MKGDVYDEVIGVGVLPEGPTACGVKGKRERLAERADDYPRVVVRFGDVRAIVCRDEIKWIVQRREPSGGWRNRSFHLDRDVMIERCGATGDALATLLRLPERFGD